MTQYSSKRDSLLSTNSDIYEVVMLSDKSGNIINSFSSIANINLSLGNIEGHTFVNNSGTSASTTGSATGSIWGVTDTVYPWLTVVSGGTLTIDCRNPTNNNVDTSDDGKTVHVYGLDSNFNPIEEEILITGSSGVGVKTFYRINGMLFHGNITSNLTRIDAKMGATIVSRILKGAGSASSIIYTVPAGYTGFITKGTSSCNYSGDATVRMFMRLFDQTDPHGFVSGHVFEINGSGGQYLYDFSAPIVIPEKSDIDVRLTARQNNTVVTASYDIILIDNNYL